MVLLGRITMSNFWINCYVARETEAAYGVALCKRGTFEVDSVKFTWIPKAKIAEPDETTLMDIEITMHNESVVRVATPMSFLVDAAFLEKIKAIDYGFE